MVYLFLNGFNMIVECIYITSWVLLLLCFAAPLLDRPSCFWWFFCLLLIYCYCIAIIVVSITLIAIIVAVIVVSTTLIGIIVASVVSCAVVPWGQPSVDHWPCGAAVRAITGFFWSLNNQFLPSFSLLLIFSFFSLRDSWTIFSVQLLTMLCSHWTSINCGVLIQYQYWIVACYFNIIIGLARRNWMLFISLQLTLTELQIKIKNVLSNPKRQIMDNPPELDFASIHTNCSLNARL